MTHKQFKAALELLKWKQTHAAIFFGVTDRTVRRWVAGDADIPPAVVFTIRAMLAQNMSPADAQKIIDGNAN